MALSGRPGPRSLAGWTRTRTATSAGTNCVHSPRHDEELMVSDRAALRIGEVARRTGLSVSTVRAWERRYDLLDPERTIGGHRLYGEADVERVRAVQRLIDDGWSASKAAAHVRDQRQDATVTPLRAIDGHDAADVLTEQLKEAFDAFDPNAMERVLDDTFARLEPAAALEEVVLPAIRWVGDDWQQDARTIAREHLASRVISARLTRILRTSPASSERSLIAAGPELDEHELGLLAAAVVAVGAGWRVHFLGSRTPRSALEKAAAELRPDLVLIGGVNRDHALPLITSPPDLGGRPIVFGGPAFEAGDGQRGRRIFVHDSYLRELPATLEAARKQGSRTG